jgi:hypothetical protein
MPVGFDGATEFRFLPQLNRRFGAMQQCFLLVTP